MTPLRLIAIGAIFFFTTIAWMILGGTILERTSDSNSRLLGEVRSLWGSEHRQQPPWVVVRESRSAAPPAQIVDTNGQTHVVAAPSPANVTHDASLESSDIDVALSLEQRRKGLQWWSTYAVTFHARYEVALPELRGDARENASVVVNVMMPATDAVYDDFHVMVDGAERELVQGDRNSFTVTLPYDAANRRRTIDVRYRSRGLGTWTYALAGAGTARVKNFVLRVTTNVRDIDFPSDTLSPSQREHVGSGEKITWRFGSLVAARNVGIKLPERLNPGPVAARISFFAPVGLLFFFAVMVIVGVVRGRSLHPVNYFFLAASFFAFHLLFAYLVDVMDVPAAFAISAATSVGLVVSYLRIVQGTKVALSEAGVAQMIFLVGLSLAFFREGEAGLTVAIGSVVTLFFLMQLTARVDWAERLSR